MEGKLLALMALPVLSAGCASRARGTPAATCALLVAPRASAPASSTPPEDVERVLWTKPLPTLDFAAPPIEPRWRGPEFTVAPGPRPPLLRGSVLEAEGLRVVVDLGSADGLDVGERLLVERGDSYAATLEVERVEKARSVARSVPDLQKHVVRPGDVVVRRYAPRPPR